MSVIAEETWRGIWRGTSSETLSVIAEETWRGTLSVIAEETWSETLSGMWEFQKDAGWACYVLAGSIYGICDNRLLWVYESVKFE